MSGHRKKRLRSAAEQGARTQAAQPTGDGPRSPAALEHAHRRLQHLYDISKLLVRFESIAKTFDTALGITTETLPLHSAILIEEREGHVRMVAWRSEDRSSETMRAAKEHAQASYAYLVGATSAGALDLSEHAGRTVLPRQLTAEAESGDRKRFIVIPLVAGHRPIFGTLQLEGATSLDKTDVVFVNAIANQLAIALDRHYAEERIREQLDFTRAMAGSLGEGVLAADLEGHVTFFNKATEQLLGWSEEQALGKELQHLARVQAADGRPVECPLERVIRTGRPIRSDDHWLARRDAAAFPVSFTCAPIRRVGRITGAVLAFRDITERKEFEETQLFLVEASKALGASLDYAAALKNLARLSVPRLGDLCFFDVVTADNKIQRVAWAHADPAKESVFDERFRHMPPVDFANHPASRAIRTGKPEFVPVVDEDWLNAAATIPHHLDFMREIGVRSLMTVPVSLGERRLGALTFAFAESGRRHRPSDLVLAGEVARRAAFALENDRLYEEAQQAIHVREQILAIVSHDLRNPLGSILVGTRMLSKGLPPDNKSERLRESIERIWRSAERMQRLTEDLLDFASLQAGHLAIKRKACDPASILAETVASFDSTAQEKGLNIKSDAEAKLPRVYCDRDRIVQVLSNVVGNAVKVTPAGLAIELRAEARGHEVVFAVSDTGPGIPEEQLRRIFERYWRGSEPGYKGTGLGLAIAKGIVDAHGGRIWAESRRGHGATFFFTIPAVVDTDQIHPTEADMEGGLSELEHHDHH